MNHSTISPPTEKFSPSAHSTGVNQRYAGRMTTTPDPRQAVGLDTPPAQPPTWPPYAQPQARGRWSLPVAIVIAAIVVSASAIAIALITHSSTPAPAPAASAPAAPANAAAAAGAGSSTCTAWRGAKLALDQSVGLPDGWDWTTPGIDGLIANRNAVISKTMDVFEPQIDSQPANLANAAHAYVAARRNEVAKFQARTYTEADGVPSTTGYQTLNVLCGIGG